MIYNEDRKIEDRKWYLPDDGDALLALFLGLSVVGVLIYGLVSLW